MMYKITVEEVVFNEDESCPRYQREREVYVQVINNMDLLKVIDAVNSYQKLLDSRDSMC